VDAGASALLSFGLAGGLDPALCAGRVVLPEEIISRSGARVATSTEWRRHLRLALAELEPVTAGRLLASAQPLSSVAEKTAAFRETGAVAVDMESLAVGEVAAAHDLPFIAVRVIVDGAADLLPRAVTAAGRGGQLSMLRLIGGLIIAPQDIVPLIRLARRYRTATRSLSAVARAGHAQMHFYDAHVA
jgi:adenosylhomocysteine nucleosidase